MTRSKIQWTDRTWNPVRGCSRVSEGCRFCYAERQAARFALAVRRDGHMIPRVEPGPFNGFAEMRDGEPRWTGKVALIPDKLDEPLRWRKPSRVFVNSMSDLFHEKLSDADIQKVFDVMRDAIQHTFQVLTKRPERMLAFGPRPLPNIWLGVSVEDQKTADERIPLLLRTPAAVRFVSYEPALGPVDFRRWFPYDVEISQTQSRRTFGIDWIIVGGESGPHARPFNIEWARSTIKACREAGVACFVKQLGAKPYRAHPITTLHENCPPLWMGRWQRVGAECRHDQDGPDVAPRAPATYRPAATLAFRDSKGGNSMEWPEDLRVREYPS